MQDRLKELVDNALDAGAKVSLEIVGETWVVSDDGPGLDPAAVPRLFSVNRPLLSSKLKRLPLRGMLGNGLRAVVGAVAATGGMLQVESRGRRLTLVLSHETGTSSIVSEVPVPLRQGVTVSLALPYSQEDDASLALASIRIAHHGQTYITPAHRQRGGMGRGIFTSYSPRSYRDKPR